MEDPRYWPGSGPRPTIKLHSTISGWLWEIRTWMAGIIGNPTEHVTEASKLGDVVKDRMVAWQAQFKLLYPTKPMEAINCKALECKARKTRGLGGTLELSCSTQFLTAMIGWALRAKRRPPAYVNNVLPLFRSVVQHVFESIPDSDRVIRFQSIP